MNVDITTAFSQFFDIFGSIIQYMKNFYITLGGITFNLWVLFWSVLLIELVIWFLWKIIIGD